VRRLVVFFLAVAVVSVAWVPEGSACWWRRRAGWGYSPLPVYPQPAPVVVYAPGAPPAAVAAPLAIPVTPPQAAVPAAALAAATPAAPTAPRTFRSPKGRVYRVIPTNERGESEEEELRAPAPTAARRPSDGEHFAGSARKDAKTSFAQAPVETFASPGALIDSLLKGQDPASNDAEMRAKAKHSAGRLPEEQRNVKVNAFLYATKKEADNDFHMLIGGDPDRGDRRFMTAEVSGLPDPDNNLTPRFQRVRDQFKAYFLSDPAGESALPGQNYLRFDPPIPVTVTGSVFFDVDHGRGEVHTGNIAPETVWEIHPVSDIVFEP
jgi:hypothetical protein